MTKDHPLLEKQRLTYLEHLGIDNYVSNYQLPHAAPSVLLPDELLVEPTAFSTADLQMDATVVLQEESATTIEQERLTAETSEQEGDRASPVIESLLEPSTSSVATQSIVTPHQKDDEINAVSGGDEEKAERPIRFALSIWRIQNDVLVIDSRQPGAALPTEKLLQNILRSIHLPLAQLPPSELLRWPLFKDDQHNPNEEQEARAMVQAYIAAQLTNAPVKHLLLLGKEATQFSLSIDQPIAAFYETHQGKTLAQPQWGANILVAPSLVDMLLEPLQKRVTWQALQSILVED